ncbi:MAG: kynureninase [Candidatus Marinimicrobia bacterium]|nr:kynureninase [Candidatus Neomarinimicrobiota bacterium]|tara:strand:+ start:1107 stop:2372 length:1266 start_codon:yes stop_codon:yes gene_type:complete
MTDFFPEQAFAKEMDGHDPLAVYRGKFHMPKNTKGEDNIYFVGNSLGLQPTRAMEFIWEEMEMWKTSAADGHHSGKRPWVLYETTLSEKTARVVGANPSEVVVMNSLTVNLHFLMVSFYRPTKDRYKILMEEKAFPSDQYAVASQLRLHGFDPEDGMIEVCPKEGRSTICNEDIIETIQRDGDSIALILFGGVNYYTGQCFDMEKIAEAGRAQGCVVGFDLAHASGNIPLQLHDWDVDFATWCNYKYINAGPGSVASAFVHEKHSNHDHLPRLAGWWGHNRETRFKMPRQFDPIPGAEGWQVSNINVLSAAPLLASLNLFDEVGMNALRKKSFMLTGYLEYLLDEASTDGFTIISPRNPEYRGCQLSLQFGGNAKDIHKRLNEKGIICDYRKPGVIRVAPVPFYNSFMDVFNFVKELKKLL